jgi:L-iditol 2-dehydrogenase
LRAVRLSGPGLVDVDDVPDPRPAPGEVLVRIRSAALCATDRRAANRGLPRVVPPPRILGHEGAGTLDDGTEVGIHPNLGCGRCAWCAAGLENRCPDHLDLGRDRDGVLAEWIAVPEGHLVPLDGFDIGLAPLVEPLACLVHAISMLEVRPGDRTLVVGAGSLGILGMWALQAEGATVAVMQRSKPRRGLARDLGADAVLGPEDDPAAALGGAIGAAIVTAPGADALAWALDHVAVGGRVHAFAGTPGGAAVDANVVHYRHLALVGSTGSTVEDFRRALGLAASGRVPVDRLPRATVGLEEVPGILLDPAPDPLVLKFTVRS